MVKADETPVIALNFDIDVYLDHSSYRRVEYYLNR
jgi:hypothetical protein